MNKISTLIFIALLCSTGITYAQDKWTVDRNYILLNDTALFLNGVNYVPPLHWMMMLEDWDESQAEKDIAGMKSIGVKCVRFFPLWNLVQPAPDKLNEKVMQRIDRVLELGAKYGMFFQITPITGWMSGGTFLPDWALGNVFTDPKIIEGEKFLVREFAKRYKDNPALEGFDFGNEINVLVDQMKLEVTPDDIDKWMHTIYSAFKEGAPDVIITNGIGTGFDPYFNIEAISRSCDYMSVHSYPFFHGTSRLDPGIGQRTLYSGNFISEWAAMVHKPVLLQENGSARPGTNAARGLRVYYISSWAEGDAGYFWWGSHMVDRAYKINTPGLRPEYSLNNMKSGELGADKRMGLLSTENLPEETGKAYQECTGWIDQLGEGWKDLLPVCYIIVPYTTEFHNTMLRYITPFVLAKQAHFDVKILWENREVPADAAAVVIAGFRLSPEGEKMIGRYLKKGGKVYQSWYNDLAENIKFSDRPDIYMDSLVLNLSEAAKETLVNLSVRMIKDSIRSISFNNPKVVSLNQPLNLNDDKDGYKNVFVKTRVGKGTYYYLGANIEESLGKLRNPWAADDSWLFYEAFRPNTEFQVDNKYVEFFHKKRGSEEILVFINHENSPQTVPVHSVKPVKLEDAFDSQDYGTNSDFTFQLEPAGVLFLKVTRN